MARKGLGKGLDSLIPDFYNEDFDSNEALSLEDMLNDNDEVKEEPQVQEEVQEEIEEENDKEGSDVSVGEEEDKGDSQTVDIPEVVESPSENLHSDENGQETVRPSQKIEVKQEHIDEVKEIVDKNPRITLWSSRSAAVFRYLRKTEPEFSISKEASVLIDEAVAKKYPEIWDLFDEY